jgi:hypothetical protein
MLFRSFTFALVVCMLVWLAAGAAAIHVFRLFVA